MPDWKVDNKDLLEQLSKLATSLVGGVLANVDLHNFCCLIYDLQTLDLGKIYNITMKLA